MAEVLWGGRFKEPLDDDLKAYSQSLSVDQKLVSFDCMCSIAHAQMLKKQRIIPAKKANNIIKALKKIHQDIKTDKFKCNVDVEDIHSCLQLALEKKIGGDAQYLHTARSRNDQVITDLRMWCKDMVSDLIKGIKDMQKSLVAFADKNTDVIIPGYTHTKHAQPVLLSHFCLSYVEELELSAQRFKESLERIDVCPLGSCALAGTSLSSDRIYTADKLNFKKVSANSIQAVSSRDFVLEILSNLSLLSVCISRLSEDIILYTSDEFSFLKLPDSLSTGSSIMPHKKNPDLLELARGQAGMVFGSFSALMMIMKGLPSSYNRDMQWDKYTLFEPAERTVVLLGLFAKLFKKIKVDRNGIKKALSDDTLYATDLSEYLIAKGISSKKAHSIVGRIVSLCENQGKRMSHLDLVQYQKICDVFTEDIYLCFNAVNSVNNKTSLGGTALSCVKKQISIWKRKLK